MGAHMIGLPYIAGGAGIAGLIFGAWLGYQVGHAVGEASGFEAGENAARAEIATQIDQTYREKRDAARPAINNARDCILADRVWDQTAGTCRDGE